MRVLATAATLAAAETFFEETFATKDYESRWVTSTWKGGNGPAGTWDYTAGEWFGDEAESMGIATSKDFNYHSISSMLSKPFSSKDKTLVLQFSAKHAKKGSSFCGGGYIKLMGSDIEQTTFGGDSDYKIMFGPDICGYDISRIHSIFNFQGENLLKAEDIKLSYDEKNEFTHLYTLVVKPDNTYEVFFDKKSKSAGKLHDEWKFPQQTTDDPADKKPADWVNEAMLDDPNDSQPADWSTEEMIADPEAAKPDGWDDEEDGAWAAPQIPNPEYKGTWAPKRIENPDYKGIWQAKQVPNEAFVENVYGYDDIAAIGFELWTVNAGSVFDNILVTDNLEEAWAHADEHWAKATAGEKEAKEAFDKANAPEPAEDVPEVDVDADFDDLDDVAETGLDGDL